MEIQFQNLAERHPGISAGLGACFAEAATVCLGRYHSSPIQIEMSANGKTHFAETKWSSPSETVTAAWANETDTTEWGAYAIALAVVEHTDGLVAVRRAETRSGADFYIAPADTAADDLEAWLRLEVSGIGKSSRASVKQRLRQKIAQALSGASNLPALAAVVGFESKVVAVAQAK